MSGYAEKIIGILEPKIGAAMAKTALKTQCKKCGITPENISAGDLPNLADSLYAPLKVFAGDAFAQGMVDQIRKI
ncbi:hypothetical protein [Methanofollis fontis]|uniref:Uncharacterized protein n=1 Tax=Methanofollis fontis TaxID=2052832 RepID=A0A483CRE7_9EURY|nr:hypothetical protein [Methanofollis fontis]TAJ45398.1 hypothetical protein CUJ86_01255 [Methanofollis fontis]